MPNKQTHMMWGGATGAGAALAMRNPDDHWASTLAEMIGGYYGGRLGARLPDVLEPATNPHHRDSCHSVTALVLAAAATRSAGLAQDQLRPLADNCIDRGRGADNAIVGLAWFVGAFLLRLASGFLVGLGAGYASHLALDATTPMGIPLI